MGRPGFWDDAEAAAATLKELSSLETPLARLASLDSRLDDLGALVELASEGDAGELAAEAGALMASVRPDLRALELETLLSGPYDRGDAILALHAGAGGTESQDWAEMLLRMYTRWAERHGFRVDVLDVLEGDDAGIKSATFEISGENAYGYLRAEKGVHRLVRISPFDASGRRHTSFASLDVLPDFPDPEGIEIRPEDLKVDTYRSSGAGGQHVNKTESAVRLTHLPTGIIVACQNERSQHANRASAMRVLTARLLERREEEQRSVVGELRGDQGEIAWGNQIRSYVFQPYTMVKDHRTGFETGNVEAVMDGDLDGFLRAYLEWRAAVATAPGDGGHGA
jgi:peptide chain release factor 2